MLNFYARKRRFYVDFIMKFDKLMIFFGILSISAYPVHCQTTTLIAEFRSQQANGTMSFSKTGEGNVSISRDIGLQGNNYKFMIHEFPVKYNGPMTEICKDENIGKVYGNFSDRLNFNGGNVIMVDNLPLLGQDSIYGRSLVIHEKSEVIACATIKSKVSSTKSLVGVFQAVSPGIAGTIVLRQAADEPNSDTTVDINLLLVDARSEAMAGLSLAVYKTASTSDTDGSCDGVEEMFNPLGKTSCDSRNHGTCPIGDLSAKLGLLEVPLPGKGKQHSLYIDTNLPLSGENSVAGRSLVILSNGKPLICAKIQEYQEMKSEVTFGDNGGLSGNIVFTQRSLYEPVVVNGSLSSESAKISVYKQHDSDCNKKRLGKLIATDIKLGNTPNDELTMYGPNSLMFRSLLVTKSGLEKCEKIQPKDATFHLKAQVQFNETSADGLIGSINLEQVLFNKSKAFAYSISFQFSVSYRNTSKITNGHNWHVHISEVGGDGKMVIGKKCMSCQGHYNPYKVYIPHNNYDTTCNPSNPFRCELGDMSKKLGTYDIGGGQKLFIEIENYLASWHNVIGRSMVIHVKNKGPERLACADVLPQEKTSGYSMETLDVRNTSKTRDTAYFQKVISEALNIELWRVADAKFERLEDNKECMKYKFLLIDDTKSNLHQAFTDLVEDSPSKLKEFTCGEKKRGWEINKGNSSEIIGVVFGIIILIIFIVTMIFWVRRRRKEQEESSKLVDDGNTAANTNETAVNVENNDNSRPDYKVTTSL